MREWVTRIADTHYVIGSCMGPHPFPVIVRDFQKIIGEEIRQQCMEKEGRLPDAVVACVGGRKQRYRHLLRFYPGALRAARWLRSGRTGRGYV